MGLSLGAWTKGVQPRALDKARAAATTRTKDVQAWGGPRGSARQGARQRGRSERVAHGDSSRSEAAELHQVSSATPTNAVTKPRRSLSSVVALRRGVCSVTSSTCAHSTAVGASAANASLGRRSSVSASPSSSANSRWPGFPTGARSLSTGRTAIKPHRWPHRGPPRVPFRAIPGCRPRRYPLSCQMLVVVSARHIGRLASSLLVAAVWAWTLVCSPVTTRVADARAEGTVVPCHHAEHHPATKTPKFGAPAADSSVDEAATFEPTTTVATAVRVELLRPAERPDDAAHRHHFARSARGPPVRA